MLNYRVSPELLRPYVPPGTGLDFFQGETFISLVGFRFLRTRVLGMAIPFHTDFDEVNLRFYVRREEAGEVRGGMTKRGVAFIREIVPSRAISTIARLAYNEPYVCLPMRRAVQKGTGSIEVDYEWRLHGEWNRLHARAGNGPVQPAAGGLDQFITEHYWGYTAQKHGGSTECKVTHEPWRVWTADSASFSGDAAALYGAGLAAILNRQPDSAFLAEGSPVTVSVGRPIGHSTQVAR